jgi:hypothetical protein
MSNIAKLINIVLALENHALEKGDVFLLMKTQAAIKLLEELFQEFHEMEMGNI